MSETNNDYKKIIEELEKRLQKVEEKERFLNDRLNALQHVVSDIEEDIYEDYDDCDCDDECDCGDNCECDDDCDCGCNDDFEFEIVCPYCDEEFTISLDLLDDEISEIKCPKCNNVIELDWNQEDEEGCSGHCGGCHGCGEISEDEDM